MSIDIGDINDDDGDDKPLSATLKHFSRQGIEDLLMQAVSRQQRKKLMAHKRGGRDSNLLEEDEDEKKARKENDKLVNLHRENGSPADIPVTDEDFDDDEVTEALSNKRTTSEVKVEKDTKPRLKNAKYKAKPNRKAKG
jgi:hypothetical protein